MDVKNAVIYARVSTKDQEREGYSIPAQLRLLRDEAAKKGLNVVKEFRESESAGQAGRKAFLEMVELVKSESSIKVILVDKTDRLYRNIKDQALISDLIKDCKIDLFFVRDGRVIGKNSKSSDQFVHEIEAAQARFYLANLSEEVKKGQLQKARQGKYPGGVLPLGYIRNKVSKTIEIDPERAGVIRKLFELYSEGNKSIDDVYSYAKETGLSYPKTERMITRSEIERLLKKVIYTGKFSWRGQVYQGDHPAVVDSVLFSAVQDVFKRRTNGRFSKKRLFTFSRLIKCGVCGHAVTAEIKKGKYIYYHCTGYNKTHKIQYVSENDLDAQFLGIIGKASIPDDFYQFLSVCLRDEFRSKKISVARERERLETEKSKIETNMRNTFQEKLNGSIAEEFFKSVFSEYQKQLDAVNYKLMNIGNVIDTNYDVARRTIELSHQVERLYFKSSPYQKRKLINSVLSNCLLNGVTLCHTYKKPFDIFAKGVESNNMRGAWDSNCKLFIQLLGNLLPASTNKKPDLKDLEG